MPRRGKITFALNGVSLYLYPPVAKLDIAADSDSEGRGFESLRAGHKKPTQLQGFSLFLRGFLFVISGLKWAESGHLRSEMQVRILNRPARDFSLAGFCFYSISSGISAKNSSIGTPNTFAIINNSISRMYRCPCSSN